MKITQEYTISRDNGGVLLRIVYYLPPRRGTLIRAKLELTNDSDFTETSLSKKGFGFTPDKYFIHWLCHAHPWIKSFIPSDWHYHYDFKSSRDKDDPIPF